MAEPDPPRAWRLLGLAVLAALPWIAQAVGDPAWVTLATRMLIYAIVAASLDLILGYGGLPCFGHAAFYGIGGYAVAALHVASRSGDPLWGWLPGTTQLLLTLPAAMAAGAMLAAAIGALSLRTAGVQFLMITLAFAQMVYFLFASLPVYGGNDGMAVRRRNELPGVDLRDDTVFYYLVLAVLVAALWAGRRLVRSRFGRVIEGARQNPRRMAAIGVEPYRYRLAMFTIAGALAALGGALMVNQARFVSPDMMHWTKSGELMVMVILGGAASLLGPVLGAIVLVGLEDVLGRIPVWGEHRMLAVGALLVAVVLLGRGGLLGGLARRRGGGADG